MLAIRMQRNGRVHAPVYRIVVQEAQRHPLSGRVVAEVGNYNPETKQTVLDKEKVEFYLARILEKEGIKLPSWYKAPAEKHAQAKHADKLRKNQPKEEPVAEAAEDVAETPAEGGEA